MATQSFAATPMTHLLLGALAVGAGLTLLSGRAIANPSGTVDPLQDLRPQDASSDPFSGQGDASSVWDLVHQASMGSRDINEVAAEQRQNVSSEAEQFRQQRARLLLQRQPNNPVLQPAAPATPAAPAPAP